MSSLDIVLNDKQMDEDARPKVLRTHQWYLWQLKDLGAQPTKEAKDPMLVWTFAPLRNPTDRNSAHYKTVKHYSVIATKPEIKTLRDGTVLNEFEKFGLAPDFKGRLPRVWKYADVVQSLLDTTPEYAYARWDNKTLKVLDKEIGVDTAPDVRRKLEEQAIEIKKAANAAMVAFASKLYEDAGARQKLVGLAVYAMLMPGDNPSFPALKQISARLPPGAVLAKESEFLA